MVWYLARLDIYPVFQNIRLSDNRYPVHPYFYLYVQDTIGAGDSFIAGFLFSYLAGGSLRAAVRNAVCLSAAVVPRPRSLYIRSIFTFFSKPSEPKRKKVYLVPRGFVITLNSNYRGELNSSGFLIAYNFLDD